MRRVYEDVVRALKEHERVALATVVRATGSTPRTQGAKMVVLPNGEHWHSVGGGLFESMVIDDALKALASGRDILRKYSFNPEGQDAIGAVCGGVAEVLIEVIDNDPHLFIVGGGHVGQALARAAGLLGFRITIIDDRAEYSTGLQLGPDVRTVLSPPDYSGIPEPGPNTYICLVSKGYASDEAALRRVIRHKVKYIGMIGSRRKVQTVFDHMEKDGFEKEQLKKVHAPIGIDIRSETPEEIAVSILAEIIHVKNNVVHEP